MTLFPFSVLIFTFLDANIFDIGTSDLLFLSWKVYVNIISFWFDRQVSRLLVYWQFFCILLCQEYPSIKNCFDCQNFFITLKQFGEKYNLAKSNENIVFWLRKENTEKLFLKNSEKNFEFKKVVFWSIFFYSYVFN